MSNNKYPDQLAPSKKKNTDAWKEANADYFCQYANTANYSRRFKTVEEMRLNMDAYLGNPNLESMKDTYDPLRVANGEADQIPFGVHSYSPLEKPMNTLFNEELQRKTELKAVAINPDIIGMKDDEFKTKLYEYLESLQAQIQEGQNVDQKAVNRKLEEIDYWRKHSQQSAHEVMANQLLNYIQKDTEINLRYVTNQAFRSKGLFGASVYRIDDVGGEPRVVNVDLDKFTVIGIGSSDFIEQGNAWIEWGYESVADIVSLYGPKLTKAQLNKLYDYQDKLWDETPVFNSVNASRFAFNPDGTVNTEAPAPNPDGTNSGTYITVDTNAVGTKALNDAYTNEDGHILVVRFQWISQRKIGELTFYGEDDEQMTKWVDENYVADETVGEVIEWFYVNEMWRGTRIGQDIDLEIEPSPTQMRSIVNPSLVRPTYVGTIMCPIKGARARALIDPAIPYYNDYNLWANKLRHLWIRHIGPIFRIAKSRISSEFGDVNQYLRVLKTIGVSVEDDFNESDNGTYSGNMQAQSPVANVSLGGDIQMALNQLVYIDSRIREVLSMPSGRSGDLRGDEVLGTTQQAIMSATTTTADYFYTHEQEKVRMLTVMLEYIKDLWRDENVRKQYILNDMSTYTLTYDGKVAQEAEMGIVITDSRNTKKIEDDITMLGHAMAQNGQLGLGDLVNLRMSDSTMDMVRKIEAAEEKQAKRRQEEAAVAEEERRKTMILNDELETKKHARELEKIRLEADLRRESALELERIRLNAKLDSETNVMLADENRNGVVDDVELQMAEIERQTKLEITRMQTESAERIAKLKGTQSKQK